MQSELLSLSSKTKHPQVSTAGYLLKIRENLQVFELKLLFKNSVEGLKTAIFLIILLV